jgi:HEAT repeat protein
LEEQQVLLSDLLSGDDECAEAAVKQLAAYGEAAVEALHPWLSAPKADQRWWAARALAEIPSPETTPLLISALQDEDPSVRQCAALSLSQHPDEHSVVALIQALSDPDSLVGRLAANSLVKIGADAVPALLERMNDGASLARLEAARALALIGDQRSIPALFNALDSDSALLEYWANEGLERMGVGMTFFKPS